MWGTPQPRQRDAQAVEDHRNDLEERIEDPVEIKLTKMGEGEEEYGWNEDDDEERCNLCECCIPEQLD